MTRPEDWPERLAAFIEQRRAIPFAWGTQDCMMFAADAVLMLCGVDVMAQYRGAYATEAEGDALLDRDGGMETILATAAQAAGLAERAPKLAQRGDLVLVEHGNLLMAGIVTGTAVAVTGADGVAFVSTRKITRAWAV
jgi:hypothetical protein